MKITIDNKIYEVSAGKNLLETCLSLGFDLPYFCYHPAMGSVGACRQCGVKKYANAEDTRGRIVMSCMEPVTEGMIVSVNDKEARDFRAGVIEGLMTNHPHDCPICDEGGECHLQDMTVMTGHNYRRFTFKKRTFISQYLGPFLHHEMNRCIQCYRCVRFYNDYAGGDDLSVFGSANKLYFGRKEDGVLENEFSGNLVEVCPTGVFTDKTLKQHFTRKWDLTHAPSVCTHCSVGCNTLVGERYGMVRRVMNRYHNEINGYFICDRGRFGYEFVHNDSRIKKIETTDSTSSTGITETLQALFTANKGTGKPLQIMGIGSPRASLESNYALMSLVGRDRFFNGMGKKESLLTKRALELLNSQQVDVVSLKDIEKCDVAFVLCEDITQTAPRMALSLRQMTRYKAIMLAEKSGIPAWNDYPARELTQNELSPLYIAHPYGTKLDDKAKATYHRPPAAIVRLANTVAAVIDKSAPPVSGINEETKKLASQIADDLLAAERPLIVTGITGADDSVFDAVTNLIVALSNKNKKPALAIAFPECNTAGIGAMNTADLDDAIEAVQNKKPDILIIIENDIYRRTASGKAQKLFENAGIVIVVDNLMHKTAKNAQFVLPAAVWAESSGTVVNNEGRMQRFYAVMPGNESVKETWRWITDLMNSEERNMKTWNLLDELTSSLADDMPVFSEIRNFPGSGFRVEHEKIVRQTMRFSGRTAITANISVSEPKPPDDYDSPLKFSMEGYKGLPPASLIPFYWSPGWNSPQASNSYLTAPNGSIKTTDKGISVFIRREPSTLQYVRKTPEPFKAATDRLYLVPVPHIFGSEELSSYGRSVAELIPSPFLMMNEKEIKLQSLNPGDTVTLSVNETELRVTVRHNNTLSDGVAGVSVLTGMEYISFPSYGKIIKE